MWAEARKHEKKLRGLMVDYRRRAERRREFYDRIRSDPAAFLQIHGSQLRVHIDANLSSAADSSLMPWMGDNSNMIDRFDVRAHLDRLDDVTNTAADSGTDPAQEALDRQINYERYRNLVQNEFLGLNETKFLNQIYHEERFGAPKDYPQNKSNQKKKLSETKAAIAFDYEEVDYSSHTVQPKNEDSESEESSDDDYDFDTTVNIDQLDNESGHRINAIAVKFGMKNDDFVKYLDEDKTEAEKLKVQKEIENEKSMFTGRKSRRERRALKEQRLLILRAGNVEESAKTANKKTESDHQSQSSSDSEESVDETKIEFITSFGGSSEEEEPKESVEKKQKQEINVKRKRIKALINQKTEPIPVVYGPTLPGEDAISPITNTSFNKSNHSKQRTYRFNDSHRSRSRSIDKFRHRRTEGRYYPRRSRTRSPDVRRSSNRTFDRFRDRRRSPSRDRQRRRSRSRSRSRSWNRRNRRSRSRNRNGNRRSGSRRRSRSSSRSRIPRRRSRSRSRKRDDSRTRRRRRSSSRNRRRSRSRSRDRNRKREIDRRREKSSPRRSRSKSVNKIIISEETVPKDNNIPIAGRIDKIEPTMQSIPMEAKVSVEAAVKTTSEDDIQQIELPKEDKPIRVPSPPIRSYYRHDLCDSDDSQEKSPEAKESKDKSNSKDNGNPKKSLSSVSNVKTGYKSSATITPQERLKKKRQALIDRQYKLDKKAELEKLEKQQQEREDREEELREMTSKLRYRRGHRERTTSRSSSRSSKSRSRSHSRSSSDSSSSSY